jgi:hypothetical protein
VGRGRWDRRFWRTRVGRTIHALAALTLAASIIVLALPRGTGGSTLQELRAWLGHKVRKIGLSQRWVMYSPNPSRSIRLLALTEYRADGTRVRLPEYETADTGWGTHWWWTQSRRDIWQFYTTLRPKKSNPNRVWYLKGVCVREDRDHPGNPPARIVAEGVRRAITPPAAVAAGKAPIGPVSRHRMQVIDCRMRAVQSMIKDDRERRARG